jgi:hypothetical protein
MGPLQNGYIVMPAAKCSAWRADGDHTESDLVPKSAYALEKKHSCQIQQALIYLSVIVTKTMEAGRRALVMYLL